MCDHDHNGNGGTNKPVIIAFEGIGIPLKDEVDKGICIRSVLRTAETSIKDSEGLPYLDVSTSEGSRYLRTDCIDTNFYTIAADIFESIAMLHRKNVEQDQENQKLKNELKKQNDKTENLEENLRVLWSEINSLKQ